MNKHRSILWCSAVVVMSVFGAAAFGQTVEATLTSSSSSDVVARTGDSTTSAFRVFNSASTGLFNVIANGNVGIGVANPTQKLEIFNGTTLGGAVVISTPLASSMPANATIGGLRLSWKYSSSAPNNVDFQVVRGYDATDGAGLAIYTSPSNSETLERMRITSSGNVGIGTQSPTSRLSVITSSNAALLAQSTGTHTANTTTYATAGTGLAYQNISTGVTNSGTATGQRAATVVTGAGTLTGATGLFGDVTIEANQTGTITNAMGLYSKITKNQGTITTGYGLYVGNVEATTDWGVYQGAADDDNYFAGKTIIGPTPPPTPPPTPQTLPLLLDVRGNVNVLGSITGASVLGSVYQDVAEWVPASADMEPGTVVILNPERSNEVMRSQRAYDSSVAGVVSAQPGVLLGVAGDGKEQIATTGRVRVRVDATTAPIRIGDLLVTSDVPGTAMRSEPLEIQGRTFHQPGTIIGKALEPLASGTGEILVLLSMQ